MDKVLIKLYIPMLEEVYDMWIPTHRRIGNIVKLLIKAINELNDNSYTPIRRPVLYDKITGETFDINMTVQETSIRNGTELILI